MQEVHDGLEALDAYQSLSLDADMHTASDDGYHLADTLGAPDPGYDLVIDRQTAREGLRHLPEREQTILYLRFFRGMTQSGIAEQLGLSQMHVSRLITKSCSQVRAEAMGVAP